MGTLQVNGNIGATGTITASSFLGNASSATKLETARNIQINLSSTSAAAFDGTIAITPGITGTLNIANGGTGATTAKDALINFGIIATADELNHLSGITSNVQTQLNVKVPTSRTVNGKALSSNITLSASDVSARPNTWIPSAADVRAVGNTSGNPSAFGFDYNAGELYAVIDGTNYNVPFGISKYKFYHDDRKPSPTDIGAMANTSANWLPQNGMSIRDFPDGITMYSVHPGNMIAEGFPEGFSEYATVTAFRYAEYDYFEYTDVFGKKAIWSSNDNAGWRRVYSDIHKPTPADIGAASSTQAFIYRGFVDRSTDLNTLTLPGYYVLTSWSGTGAYNWPIVERDTGILMVYEAGSGSADGITQVYRSDNFGGVAMRTYNVVDGNLWRPWHWETAPPNAFGMEYRTTEHYNEENIHTCLLSLGAVPSNTYKSTKIPASGTISAVVDIQGWYESGGYVQQSPMMREDGHVKMYAYNGRIFVETNSTSATSYNAYCFVRYTIEGDA